MKKILCLLTVISIIAVTAGCSAGNNKKRVIEDLTNIKENPSNIKEDLANINEDLTKANRQFEFDIFRQLSKEDGSRNVFISPLSISAALSMAYQGADGSTKDAIEKTLGYSGMGMDELNGSYRQLLEYLNKIDGKVVLNISNSIWINDEMPVNEAFLETNEDIFGARAALLDFSGDNAADAINEWVSRSTKGKIDKIIDPPIDPDAAMYIINAIYFKGQWARKFDERDTYNAEFYNADGTKSNVMMMSRKTSAKYAEGDDFKAVRIPYDSGKTAMYMILPEEDTDLDEFIANLEPEFWDTLKNSLKADDVTLHIPRFKLEYDIKDLCESLSELGMGEAFSEAADFSGIREGIFISSVLHKAVIEVNEGGSEAAAVTAVQTGQMGAKPVRFVADRPFIFAIAEEGSNTILFFGKVVKL